MPISILTGKDFVSMPWKNGGGHTTELFKIPSKGQTSFLFRLSSAKVSVDGPFSLFPGVDRILLLLEGNGFRLKGKNFGTVMKEAFKPISFSGEEPVFCTLIEGECLDFNVMTDKNYAQSSLTVMHLKENETLNFKAKFDFIFIYDKEDHTLYKLDSGDTFSLKSENAKTLIQIDVSLL